MENYIIDVLKEEDVDKLVGVVASKFKVLLDEKFMPDFYKSIQDYIYEHYINATDDIHWSLIKDLTDKYINDPSNYKYKSIRDKLIEENFELLKDSLYDDMIESKVESILNNKLNPAQIFAWRWEDCITEYILSHKDLWESDRINNKLLREINRLESIVESQSRLLNELNLELRMNYDDK